MAGKGGGAWKVAYADFVTAMMAFFLVMWITAQNQSVKEAIAEYFQKPLGPFEGAQAAAAKGKAGSTAIGPETQGRGAGSGVSKQRNKERHDPEAEGLPAAKPPRIYLRHNADHAQTGAVLLFSGQTADLDAAARQQLSALLPLLIGKANKIEIRGHASRRAYQPGGSEEDPWQLSYARCRATMQFLVEQGIEPQRIRLSQAGVFEPFTLSLESHRQIQNSRVEVFALSEYVHPSQDTQAQESQE